jgi:alpha,alpha-trehalose phosphorylase
MTVVYGVAGLRDWNGRISFRPKLPEKTCLLNFRLTIRGRLLEVDMKRGGVTYSLIEGEDLSFEHCGEEVTLSRGAPVRRDLAGIEKKDEEQA